MLFSRVEIIHQNFYTLLLYHFRFSIEYKLQTSWGFEGVNFKSGTKFNSIAPHLDFWSYLKSLLIKTRYYYVPFLYKVQLLSCWTTILMNYCPLVAQCLPLVDFHSFPLTKWFPITPSAIQPIGTLSTFFINTTVPGFLDVIPFLSLKVS